MQRVLGMAVLVLATLAAGCDARWQLSGQARDPHGAPLPGATLQASCLPNERMVADTGGRFEGSALGSIAGACQFRVSKPGFRSFRSDADEACVDWFPFWVGGCRAARIDAVLEPLSATP